MDISIDLLGQIEDGVVLCCDPETQFVDLKPVTHIQKKKIKLLTFFEVRDSPRGPKN